MLTGVDVILSLIDQPNHLSLFEFLALIGAHECKQMGLEFESGDLLLELSKRIL